MSLASEYFLKVRGNTHLQVELKKESDLQILQPHTPARQPLCGQIGRRGNGNGKSGLVVPVACGGDRTGLARRWGPVAVGCLGHVIQLRVGDSALSLCSLWVWGLARCRAGRRRGQGRDEGPSLSRTPADGALRSRGCSWGPGSWLLAQEASRPHFKSEFLGRFTEVIEHDVHDGHLLHLGRVDLQNRLLMPFPRLGSRREACVSKRGGERGWGPSRGGPSPAPRSWAPTHRSPWPAAEKAGLRHLSGQVEGGRRA